MKDSINLKIKNLISGKRGSIPWSELDNMGDLAKQAAHQVSTEDQEKQTIYSKYMQAEEEANTSNEPLPADHAFYNQHLACYEVQIQRKRTEAAERKKLAAERKSEQKTGSRKLKLKAKEDVPPMPDIKFELERRKTNCGKSSKNTGGKYTLSIKRVYNMTAELTVHE